MREIEKLKAQVAALEETLRRVREDEEPAPSTAAGAAPATAVP
jgi:outer membrane murein-binding lipoprotein Lpp